MKAFKNALRIIFPHLGRNKRVLRVNLEAIIPYSVQQLTRGPYEWYSVDVTKGLSVLKAFPYNLRNVIEFMCFFLFADKQQCGLCNLSVNR